ncbi:hypothetical protein PHMEG_0007911 [Phytophthora megakarya]|uniref:Uncharacterized protein n=1 Tax=Phytophthora megakarya TaxID=4795 RepID=A0A225WM21_9STRA|nr:hypothetical protein PHMEG_0007911 [Phytophthora megakarya]
MEFQMCNQNRVCDCKARLTGRPSAQDEERCEIIPTGEHSCQSDRVPALINDVRAEMRSMIEVHAFEGLRVSPSIIWSNARDTMVRKYGELVGIRFFNKSEAVNFVKQLRRAATGCVVFQALEKERVRTVSPEDSRNILQFNMTYTYPHELCRMVSLAHPNVVRLTSYERVSLFVDATFKITPPLFTQA